MGGYQRKDHFYKRAKDAGYRSRAAYKLEELDQRYRIFRKADRVLDLGCYPGGWLQVAALRVGPEGAVYGIDLRDVLPIQVSFGGSTLRPFIIKGDITDRAVRERFLAEVGGRVDVVLSDMSPALSGIKFRDAAFATELVESGFSCAQEVLRPGGTFVAKIFPGPEADEFFKKIGGHFKKVIRAKLKSTRKTSTEFYIVAKQFISSVPEDDGASVEDKAPEYN